MFSYQQAPCHTLNMQMKKFGFQTTLLAMRSGYWDYSPLFYCNCMSGMYFQIGIFGERDNELCFNGQKCWEILVIYLVPSIFTGRSVFERTTWKDQKQKYLSLYPEQKYLFCIQNKKYLTSLRNAELLIRCFH